uniref:Uncharacterized protein n=1 Tax=Cacopsylla melanoneura TaxID=428564 RepID=A0A8D8QWD7_9HEMI
MVTFFSFVLETQCHIIHHFLLVLSRQYCFCPLSQYFNFFSFLLMLLFFKKEKKPVLLFFLNNKYPTHLKLNDLVSRLSTHVYIVYVMCPLLICAMYRMIDL